MSVQERDGASAKVTYELVNRGNTVLAPRVALRTDGLFGGPQQHAARAVPVEVPPGKRVTLHETWRDPPAFGSADVTVRATAAGGAEGEGTGSHTAVPWAGAVVLVALLALGGGVLWWYVRRLPPAGPGGAAPVRDDAATVRNGDGAAGGTANEKPQESPDQGELTTTGAVK